MALQSVSQSLAKVEPAPSGQVPSEIDRLSNSVDVLESYVESLLQRLSLYTRCSEPAAQAGSAACGTEDRVEMALRVSYQRDRVDSISARVSDTLRRLEA